MEHSMRVLEPADAANRDALILELLPENGQRNYLWLDRQTGMILRWQIYTPEDPSLLATELIISNVVYDTPFPDLPAL